MNLKKNVGKSDAVLRLVAGVLMFYLGFIDNSVIPDQLASILLGVFGIIFILTAVFSICPFYNMIEINTMKNKK